MQDIFQAIKYWFLAVPYPRKVVSEIQASPRKMRMSFLIVFLFALAYSITVAIFYFFTHRPIAFPAWIPVPEEHYYFYQMFWTLPWGLATWVMLSGIGHLLSVVGRENIASFTFEDACIGVGLAWVVPAFYTQWLPETFIAPFGDFWPFWVDVVRIMIVPVIWQTLLTAIGLRVTHRVSWLRGIFTGVLLTFVSFIMFITFIR